MARVEKCHDGLPQRVINRIRSRAAVFLLTAFTLWSALASDLSAQAYIGVGSLRPFVVGIIPVVGNGAVGGVSINAQGVLDRATVEAMSELVEARKAALAEGVSANVAVASKLRKVSLHRLEQAIFDKRKADQPLDPEMLMLAGLQSVRFIFIDPESHDVIIAGPAEAWTVDKNGVAVGAKTQAPVLMLEDLLVAMRSSQAAHEAGITCSIDPSAEGLARLQDYMAGNPRMGEAALNKMAELVGPQAVTLAGVPADSHFARVMVAADFLMKRIAMGLEKSPVRDVPSYMTILRGPRVAVPKTAMPRWWLAPDYAAPLRDAEGLAFALPQSGVKVMTEDSYLAEDGTLTRTEDSNPAALDWAERFTSHYGEIAAKTPVFAELRNLMDLAIVAALIRDPQMQDRIGHDFPLFANEAALPVSSYNVPQTVASQSSFVRKGTQYVISVSGGVDLSPGAVLNEAKLDAAVLKDRQQALGTAGTNWWWD